jgi:mRNA (guanine-N7-)-methyltransferase
MVDIDKFIYCIVTYGRIQNFVIKNNINNIDRLRKFHNYIKSNLIINSCTLINAKTLLDIACGRGGDLQKWLNHKLNLQYILAFDSHNESIFSSTKKGDDYDGAIARFQNLKKTYRGKMPFINFKKLSILNPNILQTLNNIDSNKIYDIVSCQFALHYFTENKEILNNVLKVISSKLKVNGLFIGTATDGDLISNILKNGNVNIPLLTLYKQHYNNYLFYIHPDDSKKKTLTRQNYFEIQGVSSEFYLFKNELKELAEQNNLELIEYKSFYDWYLDYKKNILDEKFKMSVYESLISFLNFSFVLKKIK